MKMCPLCDGKGIIDPEKLRKINDLQTETEEPLEGVSNRWRRDALSTALEMSYMALRIIEQEIRRHE